MKKLLFIVVPAVLLAMTQTSVFAGVRYGCGGRTRGYVTAAVTQTPLEECAVYELDDCLEIGLHKHDGAAYAAHYYGDGHDYHAYCNVAGCPLDGYHEHDGWYCFGRLSDDGLGSCCWYY